ncbi:MAG TPA: universal stress protein [Nitrolancea sp.]|nr:universal stress protein [Nitrolancea sp.]
MFGAVVAALDGSELAGRAVPYASQFAARLGAPLNLIWVLPTDSSEVRKSEATTYLQDVARSLDLDVQTMLRFGAPAPEIISAAAGLPEPVIVMTTHGHGGIGRLLFGSVADAVARGVHTPVLLIRAGTAVVSTLIGSILILLDGTAYSEAALPYATTLARTFDADLWLVRVADTTEVSEDPVSSMALWEEHHRMVRESSTYLNDLVERLEKEGIRAHARPLAGFVEDEILAYEREARPDLVVIATHGRGGLRRLGFRSLAERILRLGTTPVLMIKPAP